MLDPTKRDDGRRWLLHTVPPWIDPEGHELLRDRLLPAARHQPALLTRDRRRRRVRRSLPTNEQRRWLLTLFLVMPDHVHRLVSFG